MRRPRWLGPYRLLYRIASGGMAEIHRGTRTLSDGLVLPVALKCVLPLYTSDPEFIEMLKDEARTCGMLDHPNIARIFELGNVEDQCFLAMEFVDGMDLRSIVRRGRERDSEILAAWSLYVVERALRGLHAAHERGVVHRDFSPSNILVSYEGEVKLIDFGIAKAAHNRSQTRSGVIKGKVKYMSPEQTMGKRLDARSDVFAAGVVLYESLTGNVPFHAPDDVALMEAIRLQEPDPPSQTKAGLPTELDAVLKTALAKEVGARFETAGEFADALVPLIQALAPGFEPSELGAFLCRIFARERREAEEQLSEYDLNLEPDDLTPTGQRQNYTRLVAIGPFADEPLPLEDGGDDGLRGAVEEWLAARRQEPDSPRDPEVWSSDGPSERPLWVDETGRTQELSPLESSAPETGPHGAADRPDTGGSDRPDTGGSDRPDTGEFERENETTTRTGDE